MILDENTEISEDILKGTSKATITKLKDAGLTTLRQVAFTTPNEIVEKTEIKDIKTAKKAWMSAQKALLIYKTATELYHERLENVKRIKTGVEELDALLGGGIETGAITELIGEYGAGKSQICFTASVLVQLPEEQGGLNAKAIYFDTENTFVPERVYEIAEERGLEPFAILDNITVIRAYNSEHLQILVRGLSEILKDENYKLIVVDSMIGLFRSEYVGRENLAPRQQKLNGVLSVLLRIADAYRLAVLTTNQMISDPSGWGSGQKPAGGNIMAHAGTVRLKLNKKRQNLRIAEIIDSSYLPPGEAPFYITSKGIEGKPEE